MFKKYSRKVFNKRRLYRRGYSKKRGIRRLGASTKAIEKSNSMITNIGGPSRRTLFPPVKIIRLKYAQKVVLSSNDADTYNTYALNSPYDPDQTTIGGSSARYFDTIFGADGTQAPYERYRVLGCRWKSTFMNVNSSGNSVGVIGCHVRKATNSAISPITVENCAEIPNTKWSFIGSSGSDSCHHVFTGYTSIGKILGNKNIRDNENAAAPYNNDPADLVYMDIMYRTVNSSGTTYTVQVSTELEYIIECYSQNAPASS